ncbi:D-alanyl-D-alanine carboxypeptidase/D-alanyl-D-alanine-endopeptidase [Paracoccus nototheniae]|uniref:D-alanyl-D-alanine carboxypeptidase/D-alanyl-D-alanine-endopeptidase n=1 Tax=Paracoccus nototheniae TaxID=2489002 RepID=A0ABW4DYB4_9RHOB|nr:D-alanyl-D-alanine carboxypeptidase/D-alanyl-D-alanine-endopeptidase [Paracoccus nototheniae]
MSMDRRRFLTSALAGAILPSVLNAQGTLPRPPQRPPVDPRDLLRRAALPGQTAYALTDAGGPLAMARAEIPLAPASTMKAVTALYALDRLGPGHRFATQLIRAGDLLVLAGGGDPVLSTDDLAALAEQLAQSGQPAPARFAVWGGALPHLAEIADEQADHLPYNPAISGMMLNFNRVYLGWARVGSGHQISVEARAARQSPRAYTITAMPGDHRDLFTYRHDLEREYWTISRAAMGRTGSRWLPVRLPELYAADVFQTLCRARGVVLPAPEVIDRLPEGQVVARHDSPPVQSLIRDMLQFSTNLTAEALGLHASGAATPAASAEAMQQWLAGADQGDLGQGMRLADHSGLSQGSRISPFAMTRILAGPGRDLMLAPLLRQDPLSDGTETADLPRMAAKTGTLNFVSNLAGYVTSPSGAEGVFAIFCEDPARRQAAIGQELPDGVAVWTRQAKALQRDLTRAFAQRLESESPRR